MQSELIFNNNNKLNSKLYSNFIKQKKHMEDELINCIKPISLCHFKFFKMATISGSFLPDSLECEYELKAIVEVICFSIS